MVGDHSHGLLDTNIMILRRWVDPDNFTGLDGLLTVVPVTRPAVLHSR